MVLIGDKQLKWLLSSWASILKSGPIPRHVAFIMDGNRRFAKKKGIETSKGHSSGYDTAEIALDWCINLGITEMTVYAFSIENFKRSADEVKTIIDLCKKQFTRMLEPNGLINRYSLCLRCIGDFSLIPSDLQEIMARAVTTSAKHDRFFLNICFAYTARDDMCMAMREMAAGVKNGMIKQSDISASLLEKCMYTSHCQNLDILIRTSGEVRLSDFMLWESSFSLLAFENVLWPEMSIITLYKAILRYQRTFDKIQHAKGIYLAQCEKAQRESDLVCVMEEFGFKDKSANGDSGNELQESQNSSNSGTSEVEGLNSSVDHYAKMRQERIGTFLADIYAKRVNYIKSLTPKQ